MQLNPNNRIHNLAQLIRDNIDQPRNISIDVEGREATVYFHGVISSFWGDIDALEFSREIAALDVDFIHNRINSPGGDVFEARAIMAAISQHKALVFSHIDGVAASAATGVAIAGDEIEMVRGARFMIHNAWTLALGNANDIEATAKLLRGIDADLRGDYSRRTGVIEDSIKQWMDAETWFSAEEAQQHKFVDRVVEPVSNVAAQAKWNLAAYQNAPTPPAPEADKTGEAVREHMAHLDRRLRLIENTAA